MNTFKELGYTVVPNIISQELAEFLSLEFELTKRCMFFIKGKKDGEFMGDIQVHNSFAIYSLSCFETLLLKLTPIMETIIEKKLYPAYSYARIYYNGAIMESHRDRPSCQYSVTITLSIDETPWPIWIESFSGDKSEIELPIGSALVYSGDKLNHWRDTYSGKEQMQVFLHYVDQDGEYKDYKYDKRPELGLFK